MPIFPVLYDVIRAVVSCSMNAVNTQWLLNLDSIYSFHKDLAYKVPKCFCFLFFNRVNVNFDINAEIGSYTPYWFIPILFYFCFIDMWLSHRFRIIVTKVVSNPWHGNSIKTRLRFKKLACLVYAHYNFQVPFM